MEKAFFLWVGGSLPDMARASVISAAEAGFETILFSDRQQTIHHPNVQIESWRSIDVPWAPEEVRLKNENKPCYAAFSDLFRFAVLSQYDGWWFDCDTIITRSAQDFSLLFDEKGLVFGKEQENLVNGAVMGSRGKVGASLLLLESRSSFPILDRWGVVGPFLITRLLKDDIIDAKIVPQQFFYPIQAENIFSIFLPEECENLLSQEPKWYCITLWGETLSRYGLRYLSPPKGSYLEDLYRRHPILGEIKGDPEGMVRFLRKNQLHIKELHSRRHVQKLILRWFSKQFGRNNGDSL